MFDIDHNSESSPLEGSGPVDLLTSASTSLFIKLGESLKLTDSPLAAIADMSEDEYPGSISTTAEVSADGRQTGHIDGSTDQDWFRITLQQGNSYLFQVEGKDSGSGTLDDPRLVLYNSIGQVISTNSDGGLGRDARLSHHASSSGTYYLGVLNQTGSATNLGTYTLTSQSFSPGYLATPTSDTSPVTGTASIDGLVQGSSWQFQGAHVITYAFENIMGDALPIGGWWLDYQREAVREVLSVWESVANIRFLEVSSASSIEQSTADIAFGHAGSQLGVASGLGIFPSPVFANAIFDTIGETREGYPRLEGDVLLNDYSFEMSYLDPGEAGFWVVLHETGHALGLKHPFDDGVNSRPTFANLGIAEKDSFDWTTMSYGNPGFNYLSGFPATPMVLDIQAIQHIYGANTSYHNGDNTYYFTGDGALRTIWDTGGNDWLDFSNIVASLEINLAPGSLIRHSSTNSALAIALGVQIENVLGGSGVDTITGTDQNNILDGGGSMDIMSGGAGDDTYIVDNSFDMPSETAGAGMDTVQSSLSWTLGAHFENLLLTGTSNRSGTGNGLNNWITGNSGSNVLDGGAGADTLVGGLGSDTYVVDELGDQISEATDEGSDTVRSYLSWTLGANLEHLTLLGTKRYSATGNALDNTLTGNGLANILDGGAGADTLIGEAGNDTYVVDNINDVIQETRTLSTEIDTVRASVSWTLGANLENLVLIGTKTLSGTGNTLDNSLTGNGLANTLSGLEGNDSLAGLAGNDTLTGGAGSDTFVFSTGLNAVSNVDTITDFTSGSDRIQLDSLIFSQMGFTGTPTSEAFFRLGSAAQDADDRILYDQSNGAIYYDADGTGLGTAIRFATLSNVSLVQYTDVMII